jgi:uncharacterized membrane protein
MRERLRQLGVLLLLAVMVVVGVLLSRLGQVVVVVVGVLLLRLEQVVVVVVAVLSALCSPLQMSINS